MLAPSLADFLRVRRTDCNNRFAAAKRQSPRLDAADFSLFLRDQLSPLANALEAMAPDQTHAVLDRAYDAGLLLVAGKLAGPSAVNPAVNRLWTDVFPSLAPLVATAPRRVLGALSNAAHHLSGTSATPEEIWRNRIVTLSPLCPTADDLLIVVQLLSWRAGLAHFRTAAITAADSLPPELALEVLEAPTGLGWEDVRDEHLANPWRGYGHSATPGRYIGAFRGFGGLFLIPPLVMRSGQHLLVRSGDEAWILLADAFGATFHRATPAENKAAVLTQHGHEVILGDTRAVASTQSHSIWVGPVR
jgi:hypothetical protein